MGKSAVEEKGVVMVFFFLFILNTGLYLQTPDGSRWLGQSYPVIGREIYVKIYIQPQIYYIINPKSCSTLKAHMRAVILHTASPAMPLL